MRGLGAFWALAAMALRPPPAQASAEEQEPDAAPGIEPWEIASVDAGRRDYRRRTQLPTHGPSAKTLRRKAKKAAAVRNGGGK